MFTTTDPGRPHGEDDKVDRAALFISGSLLPGRAAGRIPGWNNRGNISISSE